MTVRQVPLVFPCNGEQLVGVLSQPEKARNTAVVIVVGGPQYRVGSHRQFLLLARALASAGYPCLRFDVRGMGDSTGEARSFEALDDDIGAAIDALLAHQPRVERIVLWGLCDGASASCFRAAHDSRVHSMVLLNPWVRTEAGEARTYLRHYYLQRLLSKSFWKKLLSGGVSMTGSLGGLAKTAAASASGPESTADLPGRMAADLEAWGGQAQVILSGQDYTAQEFEQVLGAHAAWQRIAARLHIVRLPDADHTFSSRAWRAEAERATLAWLESN